MLAILVLILVIGTRAAPQQPKWPEAWSAGWSEHTQAHFTKGTSVYNSKSGSVAWRRNDGAGDEACALSVGLRAETECHHIVVRGQRYLYYPVLAQCCYCCGDAHGCGAITPDFLSAATFAGQQTYYGQDIYAWETPEFTYYETQAESPIARQWVALFSQNATYAYVSEWTSQVNPYDLELPQSCERTKVCESGPCALIRAEKTDDARRSLVSSFLTDRFGH